MPDLEFEVSTQWSCDSDTHFGVLETGDRQIEYSAPSTMGGSGEGTNPEELLLAAVATCYTLGLSRLLRKRDLPAASLGVRVHGVVSGYPLATTFSRITVSPAIAGADITRATDYEIAAGVARDRCFIGRTLAASVSYEVGRVTLDVQGVRHIPSTVSAWRDPIISTAAPRATNAAPTPPSR